MGKVDVRFYNSDELNASDLEYTDKVRTKRVRAARSAVKDNDKPKKNSPGWKKARDNSKRDVAEELFDD